MSNKSTSTQHVKQWWWLIAGLAGLVYALLGSAIYIPDSYEHVILAECIGEGTSSRIDCANIVYTFRPPLPALLLILLSPFAHPLYGIVLISWGAAVSIPVLIWRFAPASLPLEHRLAMVGVVVVSPLFHVFGQLADARMLVLPFVMLFGLSLWRMSEGITVSQSARCAALAVVFSSLTRPESVLLLPLGALWVGWQHREELKRYLLWSLPPMVGWWSVLSVSAGRLVFAPRHWEGTLLATWDFMPLRWAKQLYGMGLWSPPARQSAMSLSPVSTVPDLSIGLWVEWLYSGLNSLFSMWLWGVMLLIFLVGTVHQAYRRMVVIGLMCAAPNLIGALLPQARDPLFQISNLFPLFLMLLLGLAMAIGQWVSRLKSSSLRFTGVILGLALSWFGAIVPELNQGLEIQAVGREATQWLSQNTPPNQRVISSFESAPVVFFAERRWEQWPNIWDEARLFDERAPILLLSSEDGFWTGSPFNSQPLPEPSAYFGIHDQWIVLYDMSLIK